MSDENHVRTQHCECGSETYHFKWDMDTGDKWIECADCGRPSKSVGVGLEKQIEWYERNDDALP
jgi:hypothetical protein